MYYAWIFPQALPGKDQGSNPLKMNVDPSEACCYLARDEIFGRPAVSRLRRRC
jgi:hypothetical protein